MMIDEKWGPRARTDYGFRDKWGRQVGLVHFDLTRGDEFGFNAIAARDGLEYGSSRAQQFFLTEQARDAGLTKFIATASKSARKRLTKTGKIHPEDAQ